MLLSLAACGGSGPAVEGFDLGPPPSGLVVVEVVPTLRDDRLGEYETIDGVGYVRIRLDVASGGSALGWVVAHELGHAIGLGHGADPSCVMGPHAPSVPGAWTICPHEVAQVPGSAVPLTVVLPPHYLAVRAATIEAVDLWNAALGVPRFMVTP